MNKADFLKRFPPPHDCPQCKFAFTGTTLSLSENGRTMWFTKVATQPLDAISVDTCWLPQHSACDYLVLDWAGRLYLVELKGSDLVKAYEQLKSTLDALVPTTVAENIRCFVIASKIPSAPQAAAQSLYKGMKKRWRGVSVTPRTGQFTFAIPA